MIGFLDLWGQSERAHAALLRRGRWRWREQEDLTAMAAQAKKE
jgi:hypothetical protein